MPVAFRELLKHKQRHAEALHLLASLPLNAKKNRAILQLQNDFDFYGIIDKIENIDELLNAAEQMTCDLDTRMTLSDFYVINEYHENFLVELTKIHKSDQN